MIIDVNKWEHFLDLKVICHYSTAKMFKIDLVQNVKVDFRISNCTSQIEKAECTARRGEVPFTFFENFHC